VPGGLTSFVPPDVDFPFSITISATRTTFLFAQYRVYTHINNTVGSST